MAGYSGTPLPQKLGLKPGHSVVVVGGPAGFAPSLGRLPEGASLATTATKDADLLVGFVPDKATLSKRLPAWAKATKEDGAIWVAWPKKASGIVTDVTEDVVRAQALAIGLVDVKVCAIDETWSGLKLVVPVAKRGKGRAK